VAASANVVVTGSIIGLGTGSRQIGPLTINNATACGNVQEVQVLTTGTTVTLPTVGNAPVGVIIDLPSGNTHDITLKGVGGDTGIDIGQTGTVLLSWVGAAAAPASFVLTSATATVSAVEIVFF